MEVTNLLSQLGAGLKIVKYTITYKDANDTAGTSKTITLFTLPQGAMVLACRTKHTVAFAGASITDMSFVVGIAGTTNQFAADLDIDAAVANTTLNQANGPTSAVGHAKIDVIATIGSTGANLTALTAGSVDVYLVYVDITTPNA